MVPHKALLLLSASAVLAGCASMNEQECLVSDWRSVGFEDGVAGRQVNAIGSYRQACSKHGVAPDLSEYRAGHSEGIEVYCRPGRGFDVGRRGVAYQGVCPADMEPDFLAAYAEGRHLYELEAALRFANSQLASKSEELELIRRDITVTAAAIVADGTPAEERARLLLETADLAKRQGELEEEIGALEVERAARESDLLAFQETLAFGF